MWSALPVSRMGFHWVSSVLPCTQLRGAHNILGLCPEPAQVLVSPAGIRVYDCRVASRKIDGEVSVTHRRSFPGQSSNTDKNVEDWLSEQNKGLSGSI